MQEFTIQNFTIGENRPLTFFLGPCAIESLDHTLFMAEQIAAMTQDLDCNVIFKASFDKANRSSIDSFRGPGIDQGLEILQKVKDSLGLAVVSDIHLPEHADMAKEVLDVIQIPAFLCRQTDLIVAAAKTQIPLSIKKGQFIAPLDMKNVCEKIVASGNNKIILTERGSTFGYNNLVADMRSIPLMQSLGFPVCFDATHAVQLPGGGKITSGNREFIPYLAKAAVACGCNLVFMECHQDPSHAKSDKMSVLDLKEVKPLLTKLIEINKICHPLHV